MTQNRTGSPSGSSDALGQQMREHRQRSDISLTEMARRVGYTKSHLSSVETGVSGPSRELVEGYERALRLEPGTLTSLASDLPDVRHKAASQDKAPNPVSEHVKAAETRAKDLPSPRAASGTMRIFVSHSHTDETWCREFVMALRRVGADVSYDEDTLGSDSFMQVVQSAITSRPIFILLISPAALKSRWVHIEFEAAIALQMREPGRIVLPIQIAPMAETDMPPFWAIYQRLDGSGLSPAETAERVVDVLQQRLEPAAVASLEFDSASSVPARFEAAPVVQPPVVLPHIAIPSAALSMERSEDSGSSGYSSGLADKYLTYVDPSSDGIYSAVHESLREAILSVLYRSQRSNSGEFCVITGAHGTPIERVSQVLADYLKGHNDLNGCQRVSRLSLDAVRRLAKIPGAQPRLPYEALQAAIDQSVRQRSVLILDHVEVLDPDRALDPGGEIEQSLETVLSAPGKALIVVLYWESLPPTTKYDGVFALPNGKHVHTPPYTALQTRATIEHHFARRWKAEIGCVYDDNAFETIYALEPWIQAHGERETLPYLAVWIGRDAARMLAAPDGAERVHQSIARARMELVEMREHIKHYSELVKYFDRVVADMERDLRTLEADPVPKRGDMPVLTRGHVVAQLLGSGSHKVVLPLSRPSLPLNYTPDLSKVTAPARTSTPSKPNKTSKESTSRQKT